MDHRQAVTITDSCFDILYAESMLNTIKNLVKTACLGCWFDDLSQRTHTCLNYDSKCVIENYFDVAIQRIPEDDLLQRWSNTIEKYDISSELLGLQKLKYFCDDWRQTMKSESWCRKMKKMIFTINELEKRL